MDFSEHMPLIAILRGIRPDEVEAHVSALLEAGITLIEIPTNSPDWKRSVELAAGMARGRAIIGAGTVLDSNSVDALLNAGGQLMVTPNTDPDVIRFAVSKGLYCAIGFATASEAFIALGAGAQALKLFPASTYGPAHVRALKAVLPSSVPVYAVGGVNLENLHSFVDAGCVGAGLGGDLYSPGQSVETTSARARAFVAAFERTKN